MAASHTGDAETPVVPGYGTTIPRTGDGLSESPEESPVGALPVPPVDKMRGGLQRGLSTRQVSMIAIGGTIGTGLFLGTGRSLAQGGPASMLICYGIVGSVVYVTLLLLGEMATQYPVAVARCCAGKQGYSSTM